jgi:hypothetical protein
LKTAFDLDNTIDANPSEFQSMMSALQAAGHTVIVLTGTSDPTATQQRWQEKANYLTSIGCGQCWDILVIMSHAGPANLSDLKAQWLVDNDVSLYADSTMSNAKAANSAGIPLVIVPQGSKIKDS